MLYIIVKIIPRELKNVLIFGQTWPSGVSLKLKCFKNTTDWKWAVIDQRHHKAAVDYLDGLCIINQSSKSIFTN